MERTANVEDAEGKAEEIANKLGYELQQFHGRWQWRHKDWKVGVWYARTYTTKLQALDGIVRRMGTRERR